MVLICSSLITSEFNQLCPCVNLVYVLSPKRFYFRQTVLFAIKSGKSKEQNSIIIFPNYTVSSLHLLRSTQQFDNFWLRLSGRE